MTVILTIGNTQINENDGRIEKHNIIMDGNLNYDSHDPIRIDNDTDLSEKASQESWLGDGSWNNPYIIENYAIDGSDSTFGIYIGNTTQNFIVKNCYIYDIWKDAYVWPYYSNSGIIGYNITNGIFQDNVVNSCTGGFEGGGNGIHIIDSQNVSFKDNSIEANSDSGLKIIQSNNGTIARNSVSENEYGIELEKSNNFTLEGNSESHDTTYGITISYSDRVQLKNNSLNNTMLGINIFHSNWTYLNNNSAEMCDEGLWIHSSFNNTVTKNKIHDNDERGIGFLNSEHNLISNNIIYKNNDISGQGIYLSNSDNNDIIENNNSESYHGIHLESDSSNNIIKSNRINDTGGGVYISESHNNEVFENNFSNNCDVEISQSDDNAIYNNIMTDSIDCFYLYLSDQNMIRNNTMTDCYSGIELDSSSNNIIKANNITISKNIVVDYGFYLHSSNDNSIFNNTFLKTNNNELYDYAIWLESCNNNLIYHNNFIADSKLAYDDLLNSWDDGYPSAGNFWYDYEGEDNNSGPDQDKTGGDGIGDSPYSIPGNGNEDTYPLTYEFVWWEEVDPKIKLEKPANNSVITSGTSIHFDIYDGNYDLNNTNYSLNEGANESFLINYTLDTSSWTEQNHIITVRANDRKGNKIKKLFNFTVDDTSPDIQLLSPENRSVIQAGTQIDLDIFDLHLNSVNYTLNDGSVHSLSYPYLIDTTSLSDGHYSVNISAVDEAGNTKNQTYGFKIDSTKPTITLKSPANKSVFQPGTTIDFDIFDENLLTSNYSLNGDEYQNFNPPYELNTSSWEDGDYILKISVGDKAGNNRNETYNFTVDSVDPKILLDSPDNNTIHQAGTPIDLIVSDQHLDSVSYKLNDKSSHPLPSQHSIDTTNWSDGEYNVKIFAVDEAGNTKNNTYLFTIDTTKPTITLNTPADNSIFQPGTTIDFDIHDNNLLNSNYSINGDEYQNFTSPYELNTSNWEDREYNITLEIDDIPGNTALDSFVFTIDSTSPDIILEYPNETPYIRNGEKIDFDVLDLNLNIVNYSIDDGSTHVFDSPYTLDTYKLTNGTKNLTIIAIDKAGNEIEEDFEIFIDSKMPKIRIEKPEKYFLNSTHIPVQWSGNDTGSGIEGYRIKSENISWIDSDMNSSFDFHSLPEGENKIIVQAIDKVGNRANRTITFFVDRSSPRLDITKPKNGSSSDRTFIEWTGDDVLSNIDHYEIKIDEGPWIGVGTLNNYSLSNVSDGEHTVKIKSIDKAGNEASDSVSFFIEKGEESSEPGINFPIIWILIIIIIIFISMAGVVIYRRYNTNENKSNQK